MSTSKVILILGAGGNVGASTASLFAKNGYKVAIAARRLQDKVNDEGQLQIQADLSQPETVKSMFDKVIAKFGPPSVVVYNGRWIKLPRRALVAVLTIHCSCQCRDCSSGNTS